MARLAIYPSAVVQGSRLVERVCAWLFPPKRCSDQTVRRILIVEPFRLGDAALLAGMLDPLRERYLGAEIHLLLSPLAAPLYEEDGRVARVHRFVFPWTDLPPPRSGWGATLRFLCGLRGLRFDLGIDPRGDVRSQLVLALAGCRERVGLGHYLASNVVLDGRLLTRVVRCDRSAHRAEMHDAILAALGARPSGRRQPCADHRPTVPRRVVMCVGAGWAYRRWPPERWAQLALRLSQADSMEISAIGARADEEALRRVAAMVGPQITVQTTGLRDLLEQLRRADVVVSADSAAVHVASEWFGRPVVALFGPGVVSLYRPRSDGSVVVHHQERFDCAPCLQKRCVRPHVSCMPAITVDEVAEAVLQVVRRSGRV